jgi:2-keto-4-pentenoate hydratase
MQAEAIERAAATLLAARRARRPLDRLPEDCRPTTLDDAYAIQDRMAAIVGEPVAGWKIGCTSREAQTLMGIDGPFAGRVFASGLLTSPATLPAADFPMRGIEGEFAFRLAMDLPARTAPYDRDEMAEAVDLLYPAIEIIGPAFAAAVWTGVGAPGIVADNGAHGALVLGAPIDDWRARDIAPTRSAIRWRRWPGWQPSGRVAVED